MMPVVVTGVGVLHPHGRSLEVLAKARARGLPPTSPNIADFSYRDFFAGRTRRERKMDRVGQYACCAAILALRDADLEPLPHPRRTALVGGTMFGGLEACVAFHQALLEHGPDLIDPVHFPNTAHNVACSQVAIGLGIQGPMLTVTSGLGAGLDALLAGARAIRAGRADVAVVGGYDRWFPVLESALADWALLAHDGAEGLRPAEGACFLVLESASHAARRGARVRARIHGWAQGSSLLRRGRSSAVRRAITGALAMARSADAPLPATCCLGLQGTQRYDEAIASGYRAALSELPATDCLTPKAFLGETFGAAGTFAVASVLASPGCGPTLAEGLGWGGAASVVFFEPSA